MYLVFEGIVGSGKSTQSRKLVEFLRSVIARNEAIQLSQEHGLPRRFSQVQKNSSQGREQEVIHIREPGSTPIAEDIRYLAQGKEWETETMHPLTNAYLYAAARAQTLHTVVKPALERGDIIVSDRSFLSSCAYQGEAQGLGIDTVLSINHDAIDGILPDIVFYMDIDIETALSRTFDTTGDKWEKMSKGFFESVILGHEKCEKLDIMKNRYIRIDANRDPESIFQDIISRITF